MFTTTFPRAAPLAVVVLLFGAGSLQPVASAPQAAPDTATVAQTPRTTADSLHAQHQATDSLQAALQKTPSVSRFKEVARSPVARVFWALVVFVLTYFVARNLGHVLGALAERIPRRNLSFGHLLPVLRIALWMLAGYLVARGILDVPVEGLLAAAALVGIAVGFAAQDLLKNLLGGLVIAFSSPFQVGDRITVGGTHGEVRSIGLHATRLATPNDRLVTVPNAQVVGGQVSNAHAGTPDDRVVTDLYLPRWVDATRAKQIAYEAAASSPFVSLEEPIVVLVNDALDETLLTRLRVKAGVLDARYADRLMSDVTERAHRAFHDEGLLPISAHDDRARDDLTGLSALDANGRSSNRSHPPYPHPGGDSE